jgi:hypothetical protein
LWTVGTLVYTVPKALFTGVKSARTTSAFCTGESLPTGGAGCDCPPTFDPNYTTHGVSVNLNLCAGLGEVARSGSVSQEHGSGGTSTWKWFTVLRVVLGVGLSLVFLFGLFHLFRKVLNIGR